MTDVAWLRPAIALLGLVLPHAQAADDDQRGDAETRVVTQSLSARADWESRSPTDYRYRLRRQCYCASPNHVVVTVSGGRVASVTDSATGRHVDAAQLADYRTIDELLVEIDDAVARRPDSMHVVYDRFLGFPRTVDIDPSFRTADEEIRYAIESVVLLDR